MKYATQLQLLSQKFLRVQDAIFAGNKAKARLARNLAMFAVIAAVIAGFAGEWKGVIQEWPARGNKENKMIPGFPNGTEVTVVRDTLLNGFLIRANGQEVWFRRGANAYADIVPLPDGGYVLPQIAKADGSFYSHDELYQLSLWYWEDRNDKTDRVPHEAGHPFTPIPQLKDFSVGEPVSTQPWKELTTATLIRWLAPKDQQVDKSLYTQKTYNETGLGKGHKVLALEIGDDYVIALRDVTSTPVIGKFPKEAFAEYGGTDKKEIEVESWNWPPMIPKPTGWDERQKAKENEEAAGRRAQGLGSGAPLPGKLTNKTRFDRVFPYSPKAEFTLARGLIIRTREGGSLEVPAGAKVRILTSLEASPKDFAQRINAGPRSPITRHIILVGETREQVVVPASIIAEHGGEAGTPLRVDSTQVPEARALCRKDGPAGFIWTGLPVGDENVPSSYPEGEKALFEKINALRRSKGVAPLKWNEDLARAARYQAGDCYVQNYSLGHNVLDKVDNQNGKWGTIEQEPEIVGALRFSPLAKGANWAGDWEEFQGKPVAVERTLKKWCDSTPHYQLLLNAACGSVGIGNVGTMWVATFGD